MGREEKEETEGEDDGEEERRRRKMVGAARMKKVRSLREPQDFHDQTEWKWKMITLSKSVLLHDAGACIWGAELPPSWPNQPLSCTPHRDEVQWNPFLRRACCRNRNCGSSMRKTPQEHTGA